MSDLEDIPAETPLSPEEAILRRHKREKKDLQGKVVSMKKLITKNDKKKKKELAEEIAKMEEELENRHKSELNAFRPQRQPEKVVEVQQQESEKIKESDPTITPVESNNDEQTAGGKMSKAQKRREKKAAQEKERQLRVDQETALLQEGADWKVEDEKLVEILSSLNLQVHDIPSDGHCLYRAVSHQLNCQNETKSVDELRGETAEYLLENKADFINYLDEIQSDTNSYESYCSNIRNTAAWGGDVELRALSQVLKRPIRVVQADGPALTFGDEFNDGLLTLTYHRHKIKLGAHYNSVIPNL